MKTVKVCLGRFQPFTLGHLKLATYKNFNGPDEEQSSKLREQPDLKEIAKQKTIILAVSTPEEKRDTRHPFTDDIMKQEFDMIKKNYPEIEDVMYVKSADICAWGEMLKQKGYQASVWLTGSDEYKIYKMMAMKVPEYEEHNRNNYDCKGAYTPSFYVEEVKRAEGTDDFTESISGTKVRQALIDDNIEEFKKMMPKGADKFFDEFKQAVETAPEPVKKSAKRKVKEEYKFKRLKDYIKENLVSERFFSSKCQSCFKYYYEDNLINKEKNNGDYVFLQIRCTQGIYEFYIKTENILSVTTQEQFERKLTNTIFKICDFFHKKFNNASVWFPIPFYTNKRKYFEKVLTIKPSSNENELLYANIRDDIHWLNQIQNRELRDLLTFPQINERYLSSKLNYDIKYQEDRPYDNIEKATGPDYFRLNLGIDRIWRSFYISFDEMMKFNFQKFLKKALTKLVNTIDKNQNLKFVFGNIYLLQTQVDFAKTYLDIASFKITRNDNDECECEFLNYDYQLKNFKDIKNEHKNEVSKMFIFNDEHIND